MRHKTSHATRATKFRRQGRYARLVIPKPTTAWAKRQAAGVAKFTPPARW